MLISHHWHVYSSEPLILVQYTQISELEYLTRVSDFPHVWRKREYHVAPHPTFGDPHHPSARACKLWNNCQQEKGKRVVFTWQKGQYTSPDYWHQRRISHWHMHPLDDKDARIVS
jgi:hypothetical protein